MLLGMHGHGIAEVAEARWSEFDLTKKLWTIPADRMKAAADHVVPLSNDALHILKSLPRFESGDYLFSTTFGKKPVNGFSKAKTLFDKAILKALQKNDFNAALSGFVIHDLRRTVRTALSAIPNISDLVRELVIGHTRPGLHKVYDQYAYLDEKRFALDAWAARLRAIVVRRHPMLFRWPSPAMPTKRNELAERLLNEQIFRAIRGEPSLWPIDDRNPELGAYGTYEERFRRGDKQILLWAIEHCACHGQLIPLWAAEELKSVLLRMAKGQCSWDDPFGRVRTRGVNRQRIRICH